MRRYIKQYDSYSCGVIAVLNALKWSGMDVTYKKNYKKIAKECKLTTEGTWSSDLYRTLRKMSKGRFKVIRESNCTLRTFESRLENGESAIVAHIEEPKYKGERNLEAHYSFWIEKLDSNSFVGANIGPNRNKPCVEIRDRENVRRKLESVRSYCDSVYFIKRIDN